VERIGDERTSVKDGTYEVGRERFSGETAAKQSSNNHGLSSMVTT